MDPSDFVDQLYISLLKQGWTLGDIDSMDVFYYLHLVRREVIEPVRFIDEVL